MKHDIDLFNKCITEYNNNSEPKNGIGTLGERCLHSIIKSYYEPDKSKHEVKIGSFVADILNESGIFEIQTNNFHSLGKKLESYLSEYKVTIVYPISREKHIVWIDPRSGEVLKRNRSPKLGGSAEFIYEASKIKRFLCHENLSFEILLIDMDEYRLLNGWGNGGKRGSVRCDRKPLALRSVIKIESPADLSKILPDNFPENEFSFKDFMRVMKMREKTARYSLNTLLEYGAVEIVHKDKRSYIYRKTI